MNKDKSSNFITIPQTPGLKPSEPMSKQTPKSSKDSVTMPKPETTKDNLQYK